MDVALDRILDRSGEHFARWEVALAVGIDPGTTANAETEIRPGAVIWISLRS